MCSDKTGVKEITYTFVRRDGKLIKQINHNFFLEV